MAEPIADTRGLRAALAELDACQSDSEEFFAELLGGFDDLSHQLQDRCTTQAATQRTAEEHLSQQAAELEARHIALAEKEASLLTQRHADSQPPEAADRHRDQQWEQWTKSCEAERKALQEARLAVEAQVDRWSQCHAELEAQRAALLADRERFEKQQGQAREKSRDAGSARDAQLESLAKALEEERSALVAARQSAETQAAQWGQCLAELEAQRAALAADRDRFEKQQKQERESSRDAGSAHDAQLESLAKALEEERSALAAARQSAETQAAQWSRCLEELEAQRAALAADRQRFEKQIRETQEAQAAAGSSHDARFESLAKALEEERSALAAARQSAEAQGAQWSQGLAALEEQRAGLTTERERLEELRASLELERTEWQAERTRATAPPVDQEKEEDLHRSQAAWEQERTLLERELEVVRERAAEMAETVAQQRQEIDGTHVQWMEELKRLRGLLEDLSQRSPAAASSNDSAPAATAKAGSSSDPVLDSVMAQFQMLQKDLARRRRSS